MKIEEDALIIEEELANEQAEELKSILKENSINLIKINNDNLASSIIQILMCASQDSKIETDSQFLKKIFQNISIRNEN